MPHIGELCYFSGNRKRTLVKNLLLSLLSFGLFITLQAQDPYFNAPQTLPLYRNPTFMQGDTLARFNLAYLNQWENRYETFGASLSAYISPLNSYAGIMATRDLADGNTLVTHRIGVTYAQNIKLGEEFMLRLGVEASYFERTLDWSKLTFGDMVDPRKGFIYQSSIPYGGEPARGYDVGAGVMIYYKRLNIALAAHHINQPNESLTLYQSNLPMRLSTHITYDITTNLGPEKLHISPLVEFVEQDKLNFNFIRGGAILKCRGITVGYTSKLIHLYKTIDKEIQAKRFGTENHNILIGYEFKNRTRLLYSYDVTTSPLTTKPFKSHEVSLYYSFWKQRANKRFVGAQGIYF